MLVRDGMTSDVVTATPTTTLAEAASALAEHRIHQLPVVDEAGRLEGIITDRDLRDARAQPGFESRTVDSAMTRDPATVQPGDTLETALVLLHRRRFGALPVVDRHKHLKGIFTRHDCLKMFIDVLGISEPGSRIDLRVAEPRDQLARVVKVLGQQQAALISAVMTRERSGGGRRLYVRLQTIDPSRVDQALRDAGLEVIPPGQ